MQRLEYYKDMEQISHYVLIEKLGGGSAGIVYKAQDRRQGRIVALKVLRKNQHAKALEQFQREISYTSKLHNRAIVRFDSVETLADGQTLLVMPFIEGKTLDKLLIPLPLQEVFTIMEQTAFALSYAHKQFVIHCDIKPANLMLSGGSIYILDFGLARLFGEDGDGEQVGTLEYMSPEAARGQKLNVSSDLWSLGVVAYELLTGRSPFQASTSMATLKNIAEATFLLPSQIRLGLPHAVDILFEKLLSKNIQARYSSADELLIDLAALREGQALTRLDIAKEKQTLKETKTLHKLPEKPEALLGREDELALIALYLQDDDCRLLTLHGMGGIGKTHLSLWSAHQQKEHSGFEGVYWVGLKSVQDSGVIAAIANVLEVEGSVTLEYLARHISQRKQLLILDNIEHLTSITFVLNYLLEVCPRLTLLVTSRRRLALESEWVVPLYGLSIPGSLPAKTEMRSCAALKLFEERAKRHQKDFHLGETFEHVYSICSYLKGHPLGILLAATWLDRMSIQEIKSQMVVVSETTEGSGGLYDGLRQVFKQSFDLLDKKQQTLLIGLGVFEGDVDLEAAKAILDTDETALLSLLDRALLELSLDGRYTQHPLIHRFCKEKLRDEDIKTRYQTYFSKRLGDLEKDIKGSGQSNALAKIERDFAHFRTLLSYSKTQDLDVRLAEPLRVFLTHKGRLNEGLDLFSEVKGDYAQTCLAWFALMLGTLEKSEEFLQAGLQSKDKATRLLALNVKAGSLARQNQHQEAKDLSLHILELARTEENLAMVAACMANLAMLEELLGHVDLAIDYYQKVLGLSETLKHHAQTITVLNNLADLHLNHQRIDLAKDLLERALLLCEKTKLMRMKPLLQTNFGLCLFASGDYTYAEMAYLEARELSKERGDTIEMVSADIYLAQVKGIQGKIQEAKEMLVQSIRIMDSLSYAPGVLSAIVRLAEILSRENHNQAKVLASVVIEHPHSEMADRRLAEKLAKGVLPTRSLDQVIALIVANQSWSER